MFILRIGYRYSLAYNVNIFNYFVFVHNYEISTYNCFHNFLIYI